MPTDNIISDHSEMVIHQGSTSLANSAGQTNGTSAGGSANTLICTWLRLSGFNLYLNYRAFLGFDLSGISGTVTAVTLTLTRHTAGNFPIIHFLASEASDDVATTDYQDGIVGATGYPFTDDATEFTDSGINLNADGGDVGDTITVTLNTAAITHANAVIGSGKFKVAILNQYDFNNTYASSGIGDAFGIGGGYFRSTQHATGGDHPILNVTTTPSVPTIGSVKLNGAKIHIVSGKFLIE